MLESGQKAPDFTLRDKNGKDVSLSDFIGKKVVLYFYPKDNTPGCTRQACAFSGLYSEFQKRGIEVIGISKDSTTSHARFAEKHNLNFVLLSDPELEAIQAYGVWQEKAGVRARQSVPPCGSPLLPASPGRPPGAGLRRPAGLFQGSTEEIDSQRIANLAPPLGELARRKPCLRGLGSPSGRAGKNL